MSKIKEDIDISNFFEPESQNKNTKNSENNDSGASESDDENEFEDSNLLPILVRDDLPKAKESYGKILKKFCFMSITKKISKCFRFEHKNANNGVGYTHELMLDESKGYKVSFCGKIECQTCSNYQPDYRYPNVCFNCPGDQKQVKSSLKCIFTNTGKDAKMNVKIGLEKYSFDIKQILHKKEKLCKDQYWQTVWQFDDISDHDFPNGDYFSTEGSLTVICKITLKMNETGEVISDTNNKTNDFEQSGREISIARLAHIYSTVNLLTEHFSDANIDPIQEHEELGDVTLVVGKSKIMCHKFVLSMSSPVFKKMFLTNMKEKIDNQAHVIGHDLATIKTMLKYMYGKKVSDRELTPELLAAANFYEVERLRIAVENKLLDNITNNNVAKVWKTAYLTGTEDLCHSATAFIAKKLEQSS